MSLGAVLDIVIGLSFIYFLLALFSSWANEALASAFNKRGKFLFDGLREMLRDDGKLDQFVRHPLIESLDRVREGFDTTRAEVNADSTGATRVHVFPSYIPPQTVATVLLDIVSPEGGANRFEAVRAQIDKLPGAELKKALQTIADRADNDIEKLRKGVEGWYSDVMDRVTGWYKSHAQTRLVAFSVVFALILNVDTLRLARELWENPAARSELVQSATAAVQAGDQSVKKQLDAIEKAASPEEKAKLQAQLNKQLGSVLEITDRAQIPLGWTEKELTAIDKWTLQDYLAKLLGIIITAAAVTLGAPFWFDLVNKLVDVRAAGKKPKQKDKD